MCKNMKNSIKRTVLAAVFALLTVASVCSVEANASSTILAYDEPVIFSVSVPTEAPVYVTLPNHTHTATNFALENMGEVNMDVLLAELSWSEDKVCVPCPCSLNAPTNVISMTFPYDSIDTGYVEFGCWEQTAMVGGSYAIEYAPYSGLQEQEMLYTVYVVFTVKPQHEDIVFHRGYTDMVGIPDDAKNVVVPAKFIHDGLIYNVTAIGRAFTESVESVVISEGIKELNSSSFFCLPLLQRVTIPDTVTRIGYRAFWGCESLTTIDIPSSVREIDSSAFGACYSLTEVNVHNAKGVIKTQRGEPFASEDDSKINWLG